LCADAGSSLGTRVDSDVSESGEEGDVLSQELMVDELMTDAILSRSNTQKLARGFAMS